MGASRLKSIRRPIFSTRVLLKGKMVGSLAIDIVGLRDRYTSSPLTLPVAGSSSISMLAPFSMSMG